MFCRAEIISSHKGAKDGIIPVRAVREARPEDKVAIFNFKKDNAKHRELGKRLEEVPVALIVPNPNQPRQTFDDAGIAELAASISQVGLIQPLVVRKAGETYELIAGERRLRAVRSLGYEKVQCIVDGGLGEEDSALMAIVENLQREDLHFFEEAESYAALLEKLHLTQEELALRIGKSQSFIANKLRMLRFSPRVREAVIENGLTERHARALLRLNSDEERERVIEKVALGSLSVKDTEKLVESMLNAAFDGKQEGARPRPKIIRIFKDYKLFVNTVNTACEQLRESGLNVDVEQTEHDGGVDIVIKVSQ